MVAQPVIPATQEAEAGELPEPKRQRLRWVEITPLHSSLGNERNSISKKKKIKYEKTVSFTFVNPEKSPEPENGHLIKLMYPWKESLVCKELYEPQLFSVKFREWAAAGGLGIWGHFHGESVALPGPGLSIRVVYDCCFLHVSQSFPPSLSFSLFFYNGGNKA